MEIIPMKYTLLALLFALTMMSWAQSSTSNQAPAPEQKPAAADAKANCPCCEKMADMHEGMACMRHSSKNKGDKSSKKEAMPCCGKDMKASCCAGKDGQSCSKDGMMACCDGKPGEGKEMACCAGKDGKARKCRGGMQCGKHDHHDPATPGN
jgi:hypothetical protein